jgi:hypothetical protein
MSVRTFVYYWYAAESLVAALYVRPSTRDREAGPRPGSYDRVVRDVQRRGS